MLFLLHFWIPITILTAIGGAIYDKFPKLTLILMSIVFILALVSLLFTFTHYTFITSL